MTAPSPIPAPFLYNATVIDWHDGDTGTFEIDRGVYEYARWSVRLVGCNARELAEPGGVEARDFVRSLLPPGTRVVLATVKPDKYGGRLDAAVTFLLNGTPTDLVSLLIAEQWAAPWDGRGSAPVPPWPRTVNP